MKYLPGSPVPERVSPHSRQYTPGNAREQYNGRRDRHEAGLVQADMVAPAIPARVVERRHPTKPGVERAEIRSLAVVALEASVGLVLKRDLTAVLDDDNVWGSCGGCASVPDMPRYS